MQYMATGKSIKSFAATIGVSSGAIKKWAEKYPEFKNALELAKEAAQGYWEEIAHGQASGEIKGGSSAALNIIMKNQFSDDYKDKQEIEHSGDLTFLIDTGIGGPGPEEKAPPIEVEGTVLDDGDLL